MLWSWSHKQQPMCKATCKSEVGRVQKSITALHIYVSLREGATKHQKNPKPLHPNVSIFDVFPMHSFICEHNAPPISYSALLIKLSRVLSPYFWVVFSSFYWFHQMIHHHLLDSSYNVSWLFFFYHILTLITTALSSFTDRTAFFFLWTISLESSQEWDCWIVGCECIRSPFFISAVGFPVCTKVKSVTSTQHKHLNQEFYFYQAFRV